MTTEWEFKTRNFCVKFEALDELDLDLSWNDNGIVREGLESGEFVAFCARVSVHYRGERIAADYLGNCIYRSAEEFATSHRDPDPMNRNCSLMRAERGNVSICHYFPDMVAQAIAEAREHFTDAPFIRAA